MVHEGEGGRPSFRRDPEAAFHFIDFHDVYDAISLILYCITNDKY